MAIFPRYKERWFECHICGFDFPYSKAVRSKTSMGSKLVDRKCADELTAPDYRERWGAMPTEGNRDIAEQPVTGQGQADDLYESQDVYGGAGIGGAGEGGVGGTPTSSDQ